MKNVIKKEQKKIGKIMKLKIRVPASTAFVLPYKCKYGLYAHTQKINKKIQNERMKKFMNNDKVNYVIDMIKNMDIENKLRLAICMNDNYSHTDLEYDKKEMYKHFDTLLKEINIEYRTTLVNLANYPYIIFVSSKIMEMNSSEQNKVALYLFNNIEYTIKKYKKV